MVITSVFVFDLAGVDFKQRATVAQFVELADDGSTPEGQPLVSWCPVWTRFETFEHGRVPFYNYYDVSRLRVRK